MEYSTTARRHFEQDKKNLYNEILKMGAIVEVSLRKALSALSNRDQALAKEVIEGDARIDELQLQIEDRCAVLIATENPVAGALRKIITSIKIASDLERIGDHARHLARALDSVDRGLLDAMLPRIRDMAERGIGMVHDALTAFVDDDTDTAVSVAERDEKIDELHRSLYQEIIARMQEKPHLIASGTNLIFVNRFLERLGDHVTNICEWVVYANKGTHVELNR